MSAPPTDPPRAPDPGRDNTGGAAHPTSGPFTRDESASLVAEFRRLAIMSGWKRKTKTYKQERRKRLAEWATEDFEDTFGVLANNLQGWQRLCRHLGLDEPEHYLGSITDCKKALKPVFVNIIDLIDSVKMETRPKIFNSADALARYIDNTGKAYPREKAKTSPLLSNFLIEVGPRRRRRRKKRSKDGNETQNA
ncbi:hypothetical protein C8Q79DRAFT_1008753 [Trametes meyenii]|nr:hypothetical protein C8Q79DRAFT_1008753 [Trametes meyenii]